MHTEYFFPNTNECTVFAEPHGTFSKINYLLCHKASLSRYKKFEIMLYMLSDHHRLILDFNNNRKQKAYKVRENCRTLYSNFLF